MKINVTKTEEEEWKIEGNPTQYNVMKLFSD